MSSSKLRLGKGTRTTASLTEKQQIELAIALSLQQQQQHQTECPQEQEQQLKEGVPCHAPEAAADQPNAGVEPLLQEPRSRRAAAARRKFVPEDSDKEDSQVPSSNGADDYEPEPSSSDSGSGSDSDFAGDDSDDERPRKKKKTEQRTTAKKGASKPPIGRNKAGAASKASAGASLRDAKPPEAAKPAASRGRKAPAAAAAATHGPGTAASAQASHAAAPPVRAWQVERTGGPVEAAAVHVASSRGFEAGHGGADGRYPDGGDVQLEVVENPSCTGASAPKPVRTAKGATCGASVGPSGPGATAKAAPKQVIEPKKAPLHAAASANVVSKVTAVPASKSLGNANAMAASAPFRPPFSSSGGTSASAGIKLSTTAVTYRVPGLRRPSGAGVGKNTA